MLLTSSRRARSWWVVPAASLLLACGGRSTLQKSELDSEEVEECTSDEECARPCLVMQCVEGACVEQGPVVCDDADPCTADICDPESGACVFTWLTPDADGDGHRAPLPGFLPGEPGACGDDCDDTSALAHPGGIERCDGRDNDCDGIIDNGALYLTPRFAEPLRVGSPELTLSRGAGLAYGSGAFAIGYAGRTELSRSYLRGLDTLGQPRFGPSVMTSVNVMSFGAALRWSGAAFGATWADARVDGNYEVYFALFDAAGVRLGPDVRVTDARSFSVHPAMIHDSGRFVVAWDDRRDNLSVDQALIYGQLIGNDGTLLGENQPLSASGQVAEYPRLAAAQRRLGLVYTVLDAEGVSVLFQSFDKGLGDPGAVVELATGDAAAPRIVAVGSRFVVTWGTYTDRPGSVVWGVVLSESGDVIVPARPLTGGAEFARTHTTISLGDRFVLMWADTFDGNYELYAATFDARFNVLEERTRLTFDEADTLAPIAALSEDGTLGVLFDDWRTGSRQAYFMALACTIP